MPEIFVEQIKLDKQGYTKSGRYYGLGQKLYKWEIYIKGKGVVEEGEKRANSSKEVKSWVKSHYSAWMTAIKNKDNKVIINPSLKKYKVVTTRGTITVVASSKEAALRQVRKALGGSVSLANRGKNPGLKKLQRQGFNAEFSPQGKYRRDSRRKRQYARYDKGLDMYSSEKRKQNPSSLLKSGEWTPAHAIRISKGKLEILR